MPTVRQFLKKENHQIDLLVDNTETLLAMLERGELDFAIIEGVFDKEKYPHRLYKKESFLGICSRRHSFAGRTVSLEEVLQESLLVREKGSGTHMLQEQAVAARGYSLDSFSRHSSISNFSIICDLVAMDHLHMNQSATAEMTWQHLEWRTWRSLVNSILFILTVRFQNLKPIYFLQPAKALICQIVSNRKTKARCCTHRAFFAL